MTERKKDTGGKCWILGKRDLDASDGAMRPPFFVFDTEAAAKKAGELVAGVTNESAAIAEATIWKEPRKRRERAAKVAA